MTDQGKQRSSRRSFLAALLVSPLLAKIKLPNIILEQFTVTDFAKSVARAPAGDLFLVSEKLFSRLWEAIGADHRFLNVDVAQAGFDHLVFHGKPVIWYPDGEREDVIQGLSRYLHSQDRRLDITEIK